MSLDSTVSAAMMPGIMSEQPRDQRRTVFSDRRDRLMMTATSATSYGHGSPICRRRLTPRESLGRGND
jgi:hypothetical protein